MPSRCIFFFSTLRAWSTLLSRTKTFTRRSSSIQRLIVPAFQEGPGRSFTSISVAPPTAEHCDAARELGQSLLQLLPVVVRGRFLDLRLDLRNTRLDVGLLARATDDRGVLLVDHHFLGAPKHIDCYVLELDAEVGGDHGAAREDRYVLEHRLAAIAEAGGFDRRDLEPAAQLVDHEGG